MNRSTNIREAVLYDTLNFKWVKVFKDGPSKIFKGCPPQILLGPYLNTLTQIVKHCKEQHGRKKVKKKFIKKKYNPVSHSSV